MSDLKEYIVTVYDFSDLESVYDELETKGKTVPDTDIDRDVKCLHRRPISKNTHYLLTDLEAEQLRNDPRIQSVESAPSLRGITPGTFQEDVPVETVIDLTTAARQTSSEWDKSDTATSNMKNWALLRCTEGVQRTGWGGTGWEETGSGTAAQTGTIELSQTGKNVDVIICDGDGIVFNHPEYAVNADGTGGSRAIQYNWFQHDPIVRGRAAGTYVYKAPSSTNYHQTHVAGTAAGNTQGWARDANIYNIYYGVSITDLTFPWVIDYIREFHRTKPINPATGKKNPTIVNNSWGWTFQPNEWSYNDITAVTYRGTRYLAPFTTEQLNAWGFIQGRRIPQRIAALDSDLELAYAEGIIMVGAAGNGQWKHDIPGGPDWNNTFEMAVLYPNSVTTPYYYMRGTSPTANDTRAGGGYELPAICVGAVDTTQIDQKVQFSDCGPGVDLFAPGTYIISSYPNGAADPRSNTYYLNKISGTSMASPQVTGVLASALEIYPYLNQYTAKAYITGLTKPNQLTATSGGTTDGNDLQGAANRYLFYRKERESVGNIFPKIRYLARPARGAVYPRTVFGKRSGDPFRTTPFYSISTPSVLIDEGTSLTVTVNTQNVPAGTLYWTIINNTTINDDFSVTSGSFTIDNNGTGSFTIAPLQDGLAEDAQSFNISIRTVSVSGSEVARSNTITINASIAATYSIVANTLSINETTNPDVTFFITTTNLPIGTTLYWELYTGVQAADFTASSMTGSVVTNNLGNASFTLTAVADNFTESAEYFFVYLGTASPASSYAKVTTEVITLEDTSKTPSANAPTNAVAPAVTGTSTVGQTLSCTTGTWAGTAPITYTYQWQRSGVNISSATGSTYVLVNNDVTNTVRCVVTATNSVGAVSANSNSTATVTAIPTAPANTVAPAVSGTAAFGQTLSCTTGTWTGTTPITYTYQWQRSGVNISSATGSTYILVAADVGTTIRCTVTATNSVSAVSANSNSTSGVVAIAPGAPTIGTATATGATTSTVAYTAPASNGGAAITNYTATSSPGGITASGASSPITVTGLTASTAYTFTVRATNSAGTSGASSASNSITTSAAPVSATYVLSTNDGSLNEFPTGQYTGSVILTTTNVPNGTLVAWTITGTNVTTSDFLSMYQDGVSITPALTGSFEIGRSLLGSNYGYLSFQMADDRFTEGQETLTLSLNNGLSSPVSIPIIDTSQSPAPPPAPPVVVIFGDSVSTYGGIVLIPGQSPNVDASYRLLQDWSITSAIQKLYPSYTVVNVSRGGMTTSEALGLVPSTGNNPFGSSLTITQYILDNAPINKIVLRYGLADSILTTNATTTLNNLQTIIDFARGRGIEVILIGVNHSAMFGSSANPGYYGSSYSPTLSQFNAATDTNTGIISKATSQGLVYANPRVISANPKSLPDGIHPYRNYGYFITREILSQLRTRVPLIEQSPVPTATYSFSSPSVGTSVYEGQSVSFTITTTGVDNGTTLYWAASADTGTQPGDISNPSPPLGSVTITGGTGTIALTIATDAINPETDESVYIDLYLTQADRDSFINPLAFSNVVSIINGPLPSPPPTISRTYDVLYGTDFLQKVDIHIPPGTISGVIMYIHGGGWTGGSKSNAGFSPGQLAYTSSNTDDAIARSLADAGYAVVNCNYRLSVVDANWGGTGNGYGLNAINDIVQIIDYCTVNSGTYTSNFNSIRSLVSTNGLIVAGSSAGGHLALMAGSIRASAVKLVVSLSGPADLEYTAGRYTASAGAQGLINNYTQNSVAIRQDCSPYFRYGNYAAAPGREPSLINQLFSSTVKFSIIQNSNDTLVPPGAVKPAANTLAVYRGATNAVYTSITQGSSSVIDSHNLTSTADSLILQYALTDQTVPTVTASYTATGGGSVRVDWVTTNATSVTDNSSVVEAGGINGTGGLSGYWSGIVAPGTYNVVFTATRLVNGGTRTVSFSLVAIVT